MRAISVFSATGLGDGELLRRVAGREQAAFEALYDRHVGAVFALLLRMLRDRGRAEDLTQEVFLALWRQADNWRGGADSALPWLLVVARHRALDQMRSAQARRELAMGEDVHLLAAAGEAGAGWKGAAVGEIRAVMAALSTEEQQVLEMAYFDGYTQLEISRRIEAPLGTVKSWMRNGLAKVRKALQ